MNNNKGINIDEISSGNDTMSSDHDNYLKNNESEAYESATEALESDLINVDSGKSIIVEGDMKVDNKKIDSGASITSIENVNDSPNDIETPNEIINENSQETAEIYTENESIDHHDEKDNVNSTVIPAEITTTTTSPSKQNETRKKGKTTPIKKLLNKNHRANPRRGSQSRQSVSFDSYALNVTPRQRRYFLQVPRGYKIPADDCEIFCTNIPINVLESELIPLFERYGKIYELRLLMSRRNRNRNAGFAFIRYTTSDGAAEATKKLNNYEILPGKHLALRLSQPNVSLFVGNIHRGLTRDQIHDKIQRSTDGLVKTFLKTSFYEDKKNCGFCFLEYNCHSAAVQARNYLNRVNVWGELVTVFYIISNFRIVILHLINTYH